MEIIPTNIVLHQQSKVLEVSFESGECFRLPYEFLRVYSPSAEVRGHGGDGAVLQTGKQNVTIVDVEPAGQYALKITYDDGHDSGLYSWEYLYRLGSKQEEMWQDYLQRLQQAGALRTA